MDEDNFIFEREQEDYKLRITFIKELDDISEKVFKKDMRDLTNKVLISDVNDGKDGIISFNATCKKANTGGYKRYYDLEANFEDANICIETKGKIFGRERFISSNKCVAELGLGKKYISIYLQNFDN
jgi:hypothetical protein